MIFVGVKYILPVIATCDNVIKSALDLNPSLPRHSFGILPKVEGFAKYAQKSRRDPILSSSESVESRFSKSIWALAGTKLGEQRQTGRTECDSDYKADRWTKNTNGRERAFEREIVRAI